MTGTLLRLRADAYYMPVRDGVWIRTTAGSFTLRGTNAATWVQHLAPLLDRGVHPEQLYESLRPEQVGYVRKLIGALEARRVLRWEPDTEDPVLAAAFPQQLEFLRHFSPDAQVALRRVRDCPVAVAGDARRASTLAASLAENGFADIALLDAEPDAELSGLAAGYAARGVPVRFRALSDPDGRPVLGAFGAEETQRAFALADRAAAAGTGAWIAVVRGQAMLLKGQLPGSGTACLRCAWRRLVHSSVGLAPTGGLGHVQVGVAAAVLGQELFQHVATGDIARLSEGVVVDLPRLSIWRTAVDPDPTCPATEAHLGEQQPVARQGKYPDVVFGARCFGPLVSCSPEQYRQLPLAVARLRYNPAARGEPAASGEGPLVVAETMADAREEAALLAVRHSVGGVAEVGRDRPEALGRALLAVAETELTDGWTDAPRADSAIRAELTGLAGSLPEVRLQVHTCGLWRAAVDGGRPIAGLDAGHAEERALLAALGRTQLPDTGLDLVPGARRRDHDEGVLLAVCTALGRTPRPVALPSLVSGHLTGVAL